ncbi:MAG: hypothetical protein P4L77_12075 [Sulfuriferula sp.]|nr:hypothetical protein [Sulfuriferula sp.]
MTDAKIPEDDFPQYCGRTDSMGIECERPELEKRIASLEATLREDQYIAEANLDLHVILAALEAERDELRAKCERLSVEYLIPEFLAAMNDIGRYGFEKYGPLSFQSRRLKGDASRGDLKRTTSQVIADHAREHFSMYLSHEAHDHFGTDTHQLAAVAFNAMMEFYFAGLAARAGKEI